MFFDGCCGLATLGDNAPGLAAVLAVPGRKLKFVVTVTLQEAMPCRLASPVAA
jgi:hypothetical protein